MPVQKIKPISPSLREKKRYLAAEIIAEKPFSDFKGAQRAISYSYSQMYGSYGAAKAGLLFLKDTTAEPPRMLMRANAKELDKLKTSLAFVKSVGNNRVIIRSVGVSGTLKKARSKYMQR